MSSDEIIMDRDTFIAHETAMARDIAALRISGTSLQQMVDAILRIISRRGLVDVTETETGEAAYAINDRGRAFVARARLAGGSAVLDALSGMAKH